MAIWKRPGPPSSSDEIGRMANALGTFRANGLEIQSLQREQQTSEQRAAARRKAEMQKLADEFEGAVGKIIHTVSSAASSLEASANTLTSTAERNKTLSDVVASASEEASTNVQSVASATEEMASSVNEISRQVQESARIASGAVNQARKTNDRVGEWSKAASPDRRCRRTHQHDRRADQSPGAQRHDRGGPCRRGRPGLRRGGVRSEGAGRADREGHGEIGQQITGIQAARKSVAEIKEIGLVIGRNAEISATIAAAVEQQAAATQEISRNVQQAAGNLGGRRPISPSERGANETGMASTQVLLVGEITVRRKQPA